MVQRNQYDDDRRYSDGYDTVHQASTGGGTRAQGGRTHRRVVESGRGFSVGDALNAELTGAAQSVFNATMRKVFIWMFVGLAISALSSYLVASSERALELIFGGPLMFVLILAQLGLTFGMAFVMWRAKPIVLKAMYLTYTFVLGLTLSSIFLVYDMGTIVVAFAVSAVVFGSMAAVGAFIKKDLSPLGYVGYMLLFGAIIVTLINVLLSLIAPQIAAAINMFMNYVILAVFIGLTAYDMQRIKMMAIAAAQSGAEEGMAETDRIAIYGALNLFLDFINIFLRILAIFGRRRN